MAAAFLASAGGKALMSGLGQGIGSGAMSALGGLFGGKSGGTDIGASMALMNHQVALQKDYTQWLNENQYSQMRTGLESAGYNPLLAVGGATPSSGAVGIANATSGNTAQFDGLKALQGLLTSAQIANVKADTDMKNAGIITKFLGTDVVNSAKGKIKGWLNNIVESAKDISRVSDDANEILKGYITNSADSDTDVEVPRFTFQPEYDSRGSLDNTELKELKMIKRINRRRKRYGL